MTTSVDANMREYHNNLRQEFGDEDYRYAYAEDFLNTWVATQIVTLREQRGLSQQEFGKRVGTKQPGVSRLENVNHSTWETKTLKRIARALGVRLHITFETFGTLLDDDRRFGRVYLQRPDFENDPAFSAPEGKQETVQDLSFPTRQSSTMEEESFGIVVGLVPGDIGDEAKASVIAERSGASKSIQPSLGIVPSSAQRFPDLFRTSGNGQLGFSFSSDPINIADYRSNSDPASTRRRSRGHSRAGKLHIRRVSRG
jgi:transcriptional regulator with XRE-family HTH domain